MYFPTPMHINTTESQVRSYCRQIPCVLSKASGTEVWDINGNRYLDFLGGAGSLNYGHNNPELKEALLDYISVDSITHSLDIMTTAKAEFLDVFNRFILAPRDLNYRLQFTGPTGTNAVEAAFKLARKVTGRSSIVSFTNGFHGVSMGALAATGNRFLRNGAGVPLLGSTVIPYDGYMGKGFNTINYFETLLNDPSSGIDTPAAVVVEAVQGEGGLKAASANWLQSLRRICNEHAILLIVDDIQAGCGRTGDFFSFEESGITPDLVTLSKSLSGYGLPMSLLLIKSEHDIWQPGEHNGTFRGNNHAFVTATAAIKAYWQNKQFSNRVSQTAFRLESGLLGLQEQFPDHIAEIRGRGMMRGVQCVNAENAAELTSEAYRNGLILERSGPNDEVIKFLMPLTTPVAHIDEGLNILTCAMNKVFSSQLQQPLESLRANAACD